MAVDLRRLAASTPVDPAVGRAAFRIVQEALTNGASTRPGPRSAWRSSGPADQSW